MIASTGGIDRYMNRMTNDIPVPIELVDGISEVYRKRADENVPAEINEELLYHLDANHKIFVASRAFNTLKTNEERVSFAYDLLEENKILPKLLIDDKRIVKSEEYRKKGNKMFKEGKLRMAHEYYTKSIAFAEARKGGLAMAYANRSAVLFKVELYEECLSDIELAFQNDYQGKLKDILVARQVKAKELLPVRKKIEFFTPVPSIPEANRNPKIEAAADCIDLKVSEALGRHVVATRDIDPGEIIAIEKSFCHALTDQPYIHCHYCLRLCYTLIPCPNCTEAMFCSTTCLRECNQSYHQYECYLLLTIRDMDLMCRLLNLRVAIVARDKYGQLDECVLDKDGIYRSDRYDEIHNLKTNTSKRSTGDLFMRAVHSAAFYHLLKTYTRFFEGQNDEFHAIFKEVMLQHMQTGACNFYEITETRLSDYNLEPQGIGAGVFSFLSMFNHSCSPNVLTYKHESVNVVIAIKTIKKGEQCFDNYDQHYAVMLNANRKAKLKKRYLFDCTCIACTTNDYPLYEELPVIMNCNFMVPLRDLMSLKSNNLAEAKRILKESVGKIKYLCERKPSQNLFDFQESLRHCTFIFSTIKTPL